MKIANMISLQVVKMSFESKFNDNAENITEQDASDIDEFHHM